MRVSDELISRSVYDYFEARILAGLYRTGEKLPSILALADAFHLAPETIRCALLMLSEDGYLQIKPKLGCWVAYRADREAREAAAARYYAQRCDGIEDLFRAAPCLLDPLLEQALRQMDGGGLARLRADWARQRDGQIIPASIRLYAQILSALNNSLVLNLYWEAGRYLRFSCLADPGAYEAAASAPDGALGAALQSAASGTGRHIRGVCRDAAARYPGEPQTPFLWTIYRQRRQLCYTLAARIIRQIAAGAYPPGRYLPSLPKMARQLDVSLSTLRRTISILGSLGVTRSFHGKGTLVCTQVGDIDFSCPEIREGLRYYWESLQLLSLTAGPVTLHMLQTIPERDRDGLTAQFLEMCSLDRCHRCFDIVLDFITQRCPLAMVRQCYGALWEFLAWGYPFTVRRLRDRSLQGEYAQFIGQAAQRLVRRDWAGFAGEFAALMRREALMAQQALAAPQTESETAHTIEVHP